MAVRRRKRAGRVLFQALEPRRLLNSALDANGLLTVDGTSGNDDISLAVANGTLTVTLNSVTDGTFDVTQVNAIQVSGLDGDDSISLAGVPINATLSGGNGDDGLVGGAGSDFMSGNDGNDSFFANDGQPDTLDGGDGTDTASTFDSSDTFVSIESGIPVAKVTVTLGGNPIVNGSTTPIDFGTVTQGQTGPTRTFTVKNDGTDALTVGAPVLPAGFTLIDPLVGPIEPGGSESFTIQVDTSAVGLESGTVTLSNSDPTQNPFTFAIQATVIPAPPQLPEVSVNLTGTDIVDGQTTPIDFGTVNQNGTPASLSFTVVNDGTGALNLGNLSVPAGYTITDGLVASLNPGEMDTFTVRLDVATLGVKNGNISFSNNDTNEDPFTFAITGVVQVGAAPDTIVTQARPATTIDNGNSTVEFGNREAGALGPTRTFRVRNDGNAPLNVGDIVVPSGFVLIDPLIGPLAPGASESFVIQLDTSGAPGTRDGFVSIPSDDPNKNPFRFRIRGNVLPPGAGPTPAITVNAVGAHGILRGVVSGASAFSFGTVLKNTRLTRAARTFRVANNGDADLKLGKISMPAGFVVLDGLVAALKSGQTDLLTIAIDTTGTGTKSGNVSFSNNDGNENPFSFGVSGTVSDSLPGGGAPEVTVTLTDGTPIGDGAASALSFGTANQGAAGPTRTFRVKNDGGSNLTVGSVSVPSGFSLISPLAGPIVPGSMASFTVRMNTNSTGGKSGQISFSTNDSNENPFNFPISGVVNPVVSGGPAVTASLASGTLTVNGTSAIDTIAFSISAGGLNVIANRSTVAGSPFNGVRRIVVNGNDGDDRIDASALNVPVTLNGGNGNDTMIGGKGDDVLNGGNGNDVLDGGDGDDSLFGGANDDVLTGGPGLDSMKGDDGNDTINAADGLSDLLVDGGAGNDTIHKDRIDSSTNT
jgi:Ca2+-binding RTX toxin-like protein